MMQTWFAQSNYNPGGGGGFSPFEQGVVLIPPYATQVVDSFAQGTSKITTYRLHMDNTIDTASSTVDLLETTQGVRHNAYAELGKSSIYRTLSDGSGGLTRLSVENLTDMQLEVTYLKTYV